MKIWLLILLLFFTSLLLSSPQSQEIDKERIVDVQTAIRAASSYLPQFYKEKWTYYTHFTYYDLDNKPRAYAIVFNKVDSEVESIEEMKKTLEKKYLEIKTNNNRIDAIHENYKLSGKEKNKSIMAIYKRMTGIKNSIRGIDRFATVLTGAVDTLPVLLKCSKGMPEAFSKEFDVKEMLSKKFSGKQFNIARVFYLGLFDIFYEISMDNSASFNNDEQLFHLRTGKLVSLNKIKVKVEEKKLLPKQDHDTERTQRNKKKWEYYSNARKRQINHSTEKMEAPAQKIIKSNSKIKILKISGDSKLTESSQKLLDIEKARGNDKGKKDKSNVKRRKPHNKSDIGLGKPGKVKEATKEKK
jgi:hypothetical protein